MYASNFLERSIINLMRGTTLSAPSALYAGLFLSNPTDSGTAGTEVSYSGYARQQVTFALDGTSSIQNSTVITFPEAPASVGSPVTHIGIYDTLSGTASPTNLWLYGQLSTNLTIQAGVSPVFRVGSIKWTINGNLSTTYKQLILNTIRGDNASISAFTPYIGLCNGDPADNGTELSGTDYARFAVTFAAPSTDSDTATASMTSNTADVTCPNPAGSYWGSMNYAGIYNASSGGDLFVSVPLNSTYVMNEGSVAGFRSGDLTVSIN